MAKLSDNAYTPNGATRAFGVQETKLSDNVFTEPVTPEPVVDAREGDRFNSEFAVRETSGYFNRLKESFSRGRVGVANDALWFGVRAGAVEADVAKEADYQLGKMQQQDPLDMGNWVSDITINTANMLGPMYESQVKGLEYASAGAAAGALATGTMAGALGGGAIGQTYGSFEYWRQQGVGSIYREMMNEGVSPNLAGPLSDVGGAIYAGLEFLQFRQLVKLGKIGTKASGVDKLIGKSLKDNLTKVGVEYLKTVGTEVAEEGLQKVAEMATVDLGRLIEGDIQASDLPAEAKDTAIQAGKEVLHSIGPMVLLGLPGAATSSARVGMLERRIDVSKAKVDKLLLDTEKHIAFKEREDGGWDFREGVHVTRDNLGAFIALNSPKITPRQIEGSLMILDNFAKSSGMTTDKLIDNMFSSSATLEELRDSTILAQTHEEVFDAIAPNILGMVEREMKGIRSGGKISDARLATLELSERLIREALTDFDFYQSQKEEVDTALSHFHVSETARQRLGFSGGMSFNQDIIKSPVQIALSDKKGKIQMGWLKKQPGVQKELNVIGLEEFFEGRDNIPVAELQDFMENNALQVEDYVAKQEPTPEERFKLEKEQGELMERSKAIAETLDEMEKDPEADFSADSVNEKNRLMDDLREINKRKRQIRKQTKPSIYEDYTQPGGENYRETFVVAPEAKGEARSISVVQIPHSELSTKYLDENNDDAPIATITEEERWKDGAPVSKFYVTDDVTGRRLMNVYSSKRLAEGKVKDIAERRKVMLKLEDAKYAPESDYESEQFVWHEDDAALVQENGVWTAYAQGQRLASNKLTAEEARVALNEAMGKVAKEHGWTDGHGEYDHIKNPVVRLRTKDRVDAEGNKILFIEEIQGPSGYNAENMPKHWKSNINQIGVKKALAMAVEGNYDGIAWTTGQQQTDLYPAIDNPEKLQSRYDRTITKLFEKEGKKYGMKMEGRDLDLGRNRERGRKKVSQAIELQAGLKLEEAIRTKFGIIEHIPVEVFQDLINAITDNGRVTDLWFAYARRQGITGGDFNTFIGRDVQEYLDTVYGREEGVAQPTMMLSPELLVSAKERGIPLFQPFNGQVNFLSNGKAYLKLFESADVSTLVHEFAHVGFMLVGEQDHDTLAKWAKIDPATIKAFQENPTNLDAEQRAQITTLQEKFARGFEKYLREGKAPNSQLKPLFDNFKVWLKRIYERVKGSPLAGITITPEVRAIYDGLLVTDSEKYSGEIVTSDGRKHQVGRKGNNAVVTVMNEDGMNIVVVEVDNIIKGLRPTREQLRALGPKPAWKSPYAKEAELELDIDTDIEYEMAELEKMPRKQLNAVAKKLGIKNATGLESEDLRMIVKDMTANNQALDDPRSPRLGYHDEGLIAKLTSPIKTPYGNPWDLVRDYIVPILDRIRTSGVPGELHDKIYSMGRLATDTAKGIMGRLSDPLKHILKLTKGSLRPGSKANKVRKELETVVWDGDAGVSGFMSGAEGDKALVDFSKGAQEVLKAWQQLIFLTGKLAEKYKLLITVPSIETDADGKKKKVYKKIPFKADEHGRKFLRTFTDEMWTIMTIDAPAYREQLAKVIAKMNGIKNHVPVLRRLNSMQRQHAKGKPVNMEIMREWKQMPTHFKMPNGAIIQVLQSDPFYASINLVQKTALRLGFISQFGQDSKVTETLGENFVKTGGFEQDYVRLIRALNGQPLTNPTENRFFMGSHIPGTMLHKGLEGYKAISRLWKAGKLSLAWIRNLVETPAKLPAFGGPGRYMRVFLQLIQDLVGGNTGYIDEVKRLAQHSGALGMQMTNYIIDPNKAVNSLSRVAADAWMNMTQIRRANTFNEFLSAAMGDALVQDLLKGQASETDRVRLEAMGFTEEQVKILMSSRKPSKLHEAVISRMPTITQGTNALPAEQSKWANWAYSNHLIAFDSYFRTTALRMYRAGQKLYNTRGNRATGVEKRAAWNMFMQLVVGHTVSGVLGDGLRQLFTKGQRALLWHDWDDEDDGTADDWASILWQGFWHAAFGGPVEYITFGMDNGDGFVEALGKSFLPLTMLSEVDNFTRGRGPYKNLDSWDKSIKALKMWSTATGPLLNFAAMAGIAEGDPDLKFATSKYYNWARKNTPRVVSEMQLATSPTDILKERQEKSDNFRIHMAKAYKYMKDDVSDKKKISNQIMLAVETSGTDKNKLLSSIRSRKLVKRLDNEELEAFSKAVHPKVLETLLKHDEMLEEWATALDGVM